MQEDGGPAGGEAARDGRDSDQGEREAACGGKSMFLTKECSSGNFQEKFKIFTKHVSTVVTVQQWCQLLTELSGQSREKKLAAAEKAWHLLMACGLTVKRMFFAYYMSGKSRLYRENKKRHTNLLNFLP